MTTELHNINFKNHPITKYANDLQIISSPLQYFCDINHFSHAKISKEGNRIKELILTTHPTFSEDIFYPNKFYELAFFGNIDDYQEGYYLWDFFLKGTTIYQAINENIELVNGITIVKKGINYCEFYFFGTSNKDPMVNHALINNLDILESFISFFKEKAHDILVAAEKNRILLPPTATDKILLPAQKYMNTFLDNKRLDEVFDFHKDQKISDIQNKMTPRELECASYLIKGFRTKHIAAKLNVSRRTIEKHIENIKKKMNVNSILELVTTLLMHRIDNPF